MNFATHYIHSGRYDVTCNKTRCGVIIGGNSKWCAELFAKTIGYYRTKKLALAAIAEKYPTAIYEK